MCATRDSPSSPAPGYAAVKVAHELGIADDKIMQVAGPPEIVQAIKADRAAGGADYMT
ncbi:hypothetical protein [Mesorhizobium sp.]|uniref:hypothetical protein n=1 Tax=Mesorhizobium sp. TaxID=1871066 RepID=UPI0025799D85|nr:hypothetical protein [Mesorhizobium sp.]